MTDRTSGEGGPNLIDVRVGSALSRLRHAAGHSRERLAVAAGLDSEQLDAFEAGAERVGAAHLYALVTALGAPVSAVYAGMTPTPRS